MCSMHAALHFAAVRERLNGKPSVPLTTRRPVSVLSTAQASVHQRAFQMVMGTVLLHSMLL